MKLSANQSDEITLARFGKEAVALVLTRDFSGLVERFGYALSCGRDPAKAIKDDFSRCLSEAQSRSGRNTPSIRVKYFQPNDIPLFALVECVTPITEGETVLIELVVTGEGHAKHIALEQISYIT